MTSVHVRGYEVLITLAERLKTAPKAQQKLYRKAILKAARKGQKAVRSSVGTYMPSGYTPVLRKALRFRTKITRRGGIGVQIITKAKGRTQLRHVGPLERGLLRHPTYGRRPWHAQKIRSGFNTEPLVKAKPDIEAELIKGMGEVAEKIAKG